MPDGNGSSGNGSVPTIYYSSPATPNLDTNSLLGQSLNYNQLGAQQGLQNMLSGAYNLGNMAANNYQAKSATDVNAANQTGINNAQNNAYSQQLLQQQAPVSDSSSTSTGLNPYQQQTLNEDTSAFNNAQNVADQEKIANNQFTNQAQLQGQQNLDQQKIAGMNDQASIINSLISGIGQAKLPPD